MPYTGVTFKQNFERRIDKPFNDYYDLDTLKDFFSRVLTLAVKEKYEVLDKQSRYDHLRSFIVYGKSLALTTSTILLQPLVISSYNTATGQVTTAFPHNVQVGNTVTLTLVGASASISVSTAVVSVQSETSFTCAPQGIGAFENGSVITPQMLLDYMHLNSVKPKYKYLADAKIATVLSTPTSITIILDQLSSLRSGSEVVIAGIQSTTNANGTFFVQQVGSYSYRLYTDDKLADRAVGNAKFVDQGLVSFYIVKESELAFQAKPDQIDTYDKPTKQFPRWRFTMNSMVIEPTEDIVSATFNYLRLSPFVIDPEDDATDLLLFVPQEMIEFLIDKAAQLFDLETKDVQSLNMDSPQVILNK
jgi:hypothetical protein